MPFSTINPTGELPRFTWFGLWIAGLMLAVTLVSSFTGYARRLLAKTTDFSWLVFLAENLISTFTGVLAGSLLIYNDTNPYLSLILAAIISSRGLEAYDWLSKKSSALVERYAPWLAAKPEDQQPPQTPKP